MRIANLQHCLFSALGLVSVLSILGGCGLSNALNSECQNDADCDDGVFCNGPEICFTTCARVSYAFFVSTCVSDGPKVCQSAGAPSKFPC